MLPLEKTLAVDWPVENWQELTVMVAVSGGADSMALLHGLSRLKTAGAGQVIAAHFNHCLRGAESDADAAFVEATCSKLGIESELGAAEAPFAAEGEYAGLETAARSARYQFLTETASRRGARYVVTAHTADDQTETILQRILRGTGLLGLGGIPRTRRLSEATTVIRPLLSVRRNEILSYLESIGATYREDASNAETVFTRNRIRHELLPLLREQYAAGVDESLLRLGQLAEEARVALNPQVQALRDKACSFTPAGCLIQAEHCFDQTEYVVREVLMAAWRELGWPAQDMGFTHWQALADLLLRGEPGSRQTMPGGIDALRETAGLTLAKRG